MTLWSWRAGSGSTVWCYVCCATRLVPRYLQIPERQSHNPRGGCAGQSIPGMSINAGFECRVRIKTESIIGRSRWKLHQRISDNPLIETEYLGWTLKNRIRLELYLVASNWNIDSSVKNLHGINKYNVTFICPDSCFISGEWGAVRSIKFFRDKGRLTAWLVVWYRKDKIHDTVLSLVTTLLRVTFKRKAIIRPHFLEYMP